MHRVCCYQRFSEFFHLWLLKKNCEDVSCQVVSRNLMNWNNLIFCLVRMKRNFVSLCLLLLCIAGLGHKLLQLWLSPPIAIGCFCWMPKSTRSCLRYEAPWIAAGMFLYSTSDEKRATVAECCVLRHVCWARNISPSLIFCRSHQQTSLRHFTH